MQLRPYQQKSEDEARKLLAHLNHVMIQGATGSGKTALFCSIVEKAVAKNSIVWVVAPRNELVSQASRHLHGLSVSHGKIAQGCQESLAYDVHVVSLETVKRRIKSGKIVTWPSLVIVDEAHVAIDGQMQLVEDINENRETPVRVIGVTATPERADGRGLNCLYQDITYGPDIVDLVKMGFLVDVKYFSIPLEGIDKVKKKGLDLNADELDDLFKKRHILGSAVSHYRLKADGKACLVYCASIKASQETAEKFRDAGYNFHSIDGGMSYADQSKLVDALRNKEIQGLVSCDIMTYGIDIPLVECIIMLRPTMSLPLYMQMLGRGLRTYSYGDYKKTHCVILDHVGNCKQFFGDGHPFDKIDWNFDGTEKRKRRKVENIEAAKQCVECYFHFEGSVCPECGTERVIKERTDLIEVEGVLVEITPKKLGERPATERSALGDRIVNIVDKYEVCRNSSLVKEMLEIEKMLSNKFLWSYNRFAERFGDEGSDNRKIGIIEDIAKVKNYKASWVKRMVEMKNLKKDKEKS